MWREARDRAELWGHPKPLLVLLPGPDLALGFQETSLQRFVKFPFLSCLIWFEHVFVTTKISPSVLSMYYFNNVKEKNRNHSR